MPCQEPRGTHSGGRSTAVSRLIQPANTPPLTSPFSTRLPVDAAIPDLAEVLSRGGNAILGAPPGSGKTSRVPLALLDQPWLRGQTILMLHQVLLHPPLVVIVKPRSSSERGFFLPA